MSNAHDDLNPLNASYLLTLFALPCKAPDDGVDYPSDMWGILVTGVAYLNFQLGLSQGLLFGALRGRVWSFKVPPLVALLNISFKSRTPC